MALSLDDTYMVLQLVKERKRKEMSIQGLSWCEVVWEIGIRDFEVLDLHNLRALLDLLLH